MNIIDSIKQIWSKILNMLFYRKCNIKSQISFFTYVFPQKIININQSRKCPWPVHYTSLVVSPDNIRINGSNTAPGRSPGCYIQAINGIEMESDILIAPGVKIISANHNSDNYDIHEKIDPIRIGKFCWIGANAVILPGVSLGDYVIVGAGAVVTRSFPSHCTIAGVPAKIIRTRGGTEE